MRRIEIREPFLGASRAEVERLYMLDDAFNEATFRALGFAREVTAQSTTGDTLERVLTLTPLHALPGPFAALLPAGLLRITEHVSYDFRTHRGRWRTTPSALASQFRAEGTLALEDAAGGVVFALEGAADASIPLLGGRAEKHAVHTATAQHQALAAAIRKQLAAHRAAS
ncbi:MAG: DUF2505 family protein [Polyangiales bacterium]